MTWLLLVLAVSPDGGTPALAPAAPATPKVVSVADGGTSYDPRAAEVARLRGEVGQLRESNARLDEKLVATTREVEKLRAEQAELRRAAQEQQQKGQTAQQQRTEAAQQAAVSFGALDQQLLTGNTAAVEATLTAAEPSLGPSARANLQAARQAIANADLTNARTYLARAAADAQAGR